jgi:hypothetical protein
METSVSGLKESQNPRKRMLSPDSCAEPKYQTAVEDAFVAELQAVAAVPGFPRADHGVSKRIENREQE